MAAAQKGFWAKTKNRQRKGVPLTVVNEFLADADSQAQDVRITLGFVQCKSSDEMPRNETRNRAIACRLGAESIKLAQARMRPQ